MRKHETEVGRYFRACDLLDEARRLGLETSVRRLAPLVDHYLDRSLNILHSKDRLVDELFGSLQQAFGVTPKKSAV